MKDQDKTKQQLISELEESRRRVVVLERLVQENQSAAALLQAAPLGIHECDTEGRITFVNPSQEAISGFTAEELVGTYVWNRIEPGPEKDSLPAYFTHLVSEQPPLSPFFAKNIRKNGEVFDVRVDWSYKRNSKGQLVGFVCSVLDITERKRFEEALQRAHDELEQRIKERTGELAQANENLRTFFDTIRDFLFVIDQDGNIVRANKIALARLGYLEDELVGQSVLCLHPEERRREASEIISMLTVGSGTSCPVPLITKEGHLIPVETAIVQGRWNGRDVLFGVSRDISGLRASEERFAKTFHCNPLPMAITAADSGELLDVNHAFLRTLGYSKEELIGATALGIGLFTDPGRQITAFEIMRKHGVLRDFDASVRTKDGCVRHGVFSAETIQLQDQKVLLSIMNDITDRKEAMESLERERQSLWRMLQASDHERQIISYEIHDGLAQYLAAAGMQFQVFDAIRESNPEAAKKAYDAATQLVSQSHFEARRLISEVRPPIIDENGIEMAISHLVHEHRRHGGPTIECYTNVQFTRLPSILENAIYRIVQEALTNACKHSKAKRVAVTLAQEGQDVRFEVRDWGIGFAPNSVGKGHFGLEGIRQRVRLLGGRLTIESTPDSGTLIQVVVPIVERQSEE